MRDFAAIRVARLGPTDAWQNVTVADAADDLSVTYGISDHSLPDHQGVVRIGDIQGGLITTHQPGCRGAAKREDTRAALEEGDLVVVLVRRVGDAALITGEHHGWIATRGVGIIRSKDPYVTRWLRIWFRTPSAQAWIHQHVAAHVEPTLSLDALRRMRVLLPPREQIDVIHELVTLIEAKTEVNRRIAADAVELADAHHAAWTRHRGSWTTSAFGTVARTLTGKPVPKSPAEAGSPSATWVAPSDILGASLPYIEGTDRQGPAEPGVVCEPGTILLATRPEGASAAVTLLPAAPGRGVLAIRPDAPADLWWLLHELRSRCEELPMVAQGRQAREISRRAFSRLDVVWPGPDVRERFHRVVEPLHSRAQKTLAENRTLNELLDTLLRDISSRSGRLLNE
ncbi:hypothetical protein [Streptomyces sp. NPDC000888]